MFPFLIYNQEKDLQAKLILSVIQYCTGPLSCSLLGNIMFLWSPELVFTVNTSLIISCLLMEPLERCFK